MEVLKVAILFGATSLVMAIHCDAGHETENFLMKPEMNEMRKLLEPAKKNAGQDDRRLLVLEPAKVDLPPEFSRPHSTVEVPSETGGLELQVSNMPGVPEWTKHAMAKKSALSSAFKSAANVAVKAAKQAAKGATSAYKNFKDSNNDHGRLQLDKHSSDQYMIEPRSYSPPPLALPQPPPRPQPEQNMHIVPSSSFFRPSDNLDPLIGLNNYQGFEPAYKPSYYEPEPEEDKQKPPTKAEAKEARDALFYRRKELSRQEVLAYIDTLRRWPEYEQMKKLRRVPIDLDLLTRFNQTSEANCNDKKLIKKLEKMHKELYYQESEHGKALVPFLGEVLDEQLKICDFAQKSTDEFLEFANENPERWELIKMWNHKVGHYGNRHTNWGTENQYLKNGIQLNEALTEMINDQAHLRTAQDRYAYGYKLCLALKAFCGHMDRLGDTLSMTRLEKGYKKNKTVREFHRLMSVCEQTKGSNFLQALSGALGAPTTYGGYYI